MDAGDGRLARHSRVGGHHGPALRRSRSAERHRTAAALTAALYAALTMPALAVSATAVSWNAASARRSSSSASALPRGARSCLRGSAPSMVRRSCVGLFAGAAIVFKPNAGLYVPAMLRLAVLVPRRASATDRATRARDCVCAGVGAGSLVVPLSRSCGCGVSDCSPTRASRSWTSIAGTSANGFTAGRVRARLFEGRLAADEDRSALAGRRCRRAARGVGSRAAPAARSSGRVSLIWWGAAAALVIAVQRRPALQFLLHPGVSAAGAARGVDADADRRPADAGRRLIGAVDRGADAVAASWIAATSRRSSTGPASDLAASWPDGASRLPRAIRRLRRTSRGYSARANAEVADYIRQHTQPDDRIFLFGINGAGVYFLADRLTAHRFLRVNFFATTEFPNPAFRVEAVVQDLRRARAGLHPLRASEVRRRVGSHHRCAAPSARTSAALLSGYRLETTIEDFTGPRRRAAIP